MYLRKDRQGNFKLSAKDGTVYACMTSDSFLEDVDEWRQGCWDMIRERTDLSFYIITKRIDRFEKCVPPDWGDGWDHVTIYSTCENQDRTDYRLPILLSLPIKHRQIISEPMLGEITMEEYLKTGQIEHVTCGGESGPNARPCNLDWILKVRSECIRYIVHLYQSNLIDKKQANRAKHYYEKRFGPKQSSITAYSSGFIACRSWQGPTSLFIVFLPIQTGCAIIIIKQRAVGARRRVCTVLP